MKDYTSLNQQFRKALYSLPRKNNKKSFIVCLTSAIFVIAFLAFLTFSILPSQLIASINNNYANYKDIKENLTVDSSPVEKDLSLIHKDENQKTNILLIGIPGEPWPAPYLTDSIEILSINENNKNISVTALPRDLLVKIPNSKFETRINALYSISSNPETLKEKVKEITGITPHYYVIIDLATIEKIINTLGGIDIDVKNDIYDPKFPTVSRGYETFSIFAGINHLDGETAIKYIRSRHQSRGDFGRIERQQQVMEVLREKIISLNLLSDFSKILAIFENFKGKTDIGIGEIKTMADAAKKITSANIQYFFIDAGVKDSLLVYGKTILGKNLASVLWPKKGKFDYSEIKEAIIKLEQETNTQN